MADRTLTSDITEKDAGQTVRTYLLNVIGLSAHQVSRQKYKKHGICVNGESSYVNRILRTGDKLELLLPADRTFRGTEGAKPVKIWAAPAQWLFEYPLDILYEDEDLLIVNKPAGIVCHPSPGHYDDTLANQAAEHLGGVGSQMDIRITGRLDQETSGVVTIAKNQVAAGLIQRMREEGRIEKTYVALAQGDLGKQAPEESREQIAQFGQKNLREQAQSGVIDKALRREKPGSHKMVTTDKADPLGKSARTFWKVIRRIPAEGTDVLSRTLLTCQIEHGRTHQIRVHMASIGHPLVGDPLYGVEQHGEKQPNEAEQQCREKQPNEAEQQCGEKQPNEAEQQCGEKQPNEAEQQCGEKQPNEAEQQCREKLPMGLHAWKVSFRQPLTGREIHVQAPLPDWALSGWTQETLCPEKTEM